MMHFVNFYNLIGFITSVKQLGNLEVLKPINLFVFVPFKKVLLFHSNSQLSSDVTYFFFQIRFICLFFLLNKLKLLASCRVKVKYKYSKT